MAVLEIEGRQFVEVVAPPVELPQPIPQPVGWIPGANDRPFRVAPWTEYIDKDTNTFFTNAMQVPVVVDQDGVHPNWTKPVLRWDRLDAIWQHRFEELNSYACLDVFVNGGYGWCDLNPNPTTPYEGECKYNVIDACLNLRNCKSIALKNGNKYVLMEYSDFQNGPNPLNTYEKTPQLMIKQTQAVRELDNYRTSYQGDVIWDWVSDVDIALPRSLCIFYPGYSDLAPGFTPFDCLLYGFVVTVQEYCFSGSSTYIRVTSNELEDGWYLAQEQDSQGDEIAKTSEDYRCYVSGVNFPMTPPVAGWKVE